MSCLSRHLFPLVLLSSSSRSPACVVAPVAFCHKLDRKIFTAGIICSCVAPSIAGLDPSRGPWVPHAAAGIRWGEMVAGSCSFKLRQRCEIPSSLEKLLLRFLNHLLAGVRGFSLHAGFLLGCSGLWWWWNHWCSAARVRLPPNTRLCLV